MKSAGTGGASSAQSQASADGQAMRGTTSTTSEQSMNNKNNGGTSTVVTQLTPNDVLFGRGAPSIGNEGNVRFRQLVQSRKLEYIDTGKRQVKDWIARQVIQAVSIRQGRFLRKIESLVEAEQLGAPEGTPAWVLVEEGTVLQKVKQALRDRDSMEDAVRDEELRNSNSNSNSGTDKNFSAAMNINRPTQAQLQGVTQGVDAQHGSGPAVLDMRSYLEGLQQRSDFQQLIEMQQQQQPALPGRNLNSFPSTIGDLLLARQQEMIQQHALADQARASVNIMDTFQGIRGYQHPPGGANTSTSIGGQSYSHLPLSIAGFLNAPIGHGQSLPMSGNQNLTYQQLMQPDTGASALLSSIGLLSASAATGEAAGSSLISRGAAVARPPTTRAIEPSSVVTTRETETKGELAISVGFERAKHFFAGSLAGGHVKTSMIEMLLLSVLCSHGLPVWVPPKTNTDTANINIDQGDNNTAATESSSFAFAWSDFGRLLVRTAKDWYERKYSSLDQAVNDDRRTELRATVLAAWYAADPEELARKTISLLEKLRNFIGPDDTGISLWFEQELCRWALSLSIADKQLHPVAYAASDFVSAHPQYTQDDSVKTACLFDIQSCHDIILQVAYMTRLRSIFLLHKARGIGAKVDEALKRSVLSGQVWKGRPSWWDTLAHDVLLLQRLLAVGFLGILDELSGVIPASTSGRELLLSKASIQERMEALVTHLHQSQDTAGLQVILKGLEAQHFNHATANPSAIATSRHVRLPRDAQQTKGRKDDNGTRRPSAEQHKGYVEYPASKKIRKL